jgi:hypothetical protein
VDHCGRGKTQGMGEGMNSRAYQYGAKAPIANGDLIAKQMEAAGRYYNVLIEIERRRRQRVVDGDAKAKELAGEETRAARAASGCYWGTYLLAEAAAQHSARSVKHFAANKSSKCKCGTTVDTGQWIEVASRRVVGCPRCGPALGFRRHRGGGVIGVQIQGGMHVASLIAGEDTRVALVPDMRENPHHTTNSQKRRMLRLRVGSEGRYPVWAKIPIKLHRPLPDGIIKWVTLHARPIGPHLEWSATFVVQSQERLGSPLPAPSRPPVGVSIDPITGSVSTFSEAGSGLWELPARIHERMRKTYDLHSIRDDYFNAVISALLSVARAGWPQWLDEEAARFHEWLKRRSIGHLRRLVRHWRDNRFAGDTEVYAMAEAWRKKDAHLWTWESHQRRGVLSERREQYRLLARDMARHSVVAVRSIDLAWLARDKDQQQGDRQIASPAELLDCMSDAVTRAGGKWVEVPKETADDPRAILRAAIDGTHAPTRSRAKPAVPKGETAAEKRRAAGLATRRGRRSKTDTEPSVIY